MRGRASMLGLVLLGSLFSPGPAAALEVWVNVQTGSDSNTGTEQSPFATIQRGCDQSTSDAQLVVHVLPGAYRERVQVRRDGTQIVADLAHRGQVILYGSDSGSNLTWTREDPPGLPAAASGNVWWADLSAWELEPQIVYRVLPDGSTLRLTPAREPDFHVTTDWMWHEHWETAGIAPVRYASDENAADEHSAWFFSAPFLIDQWGDLTGGRVWIKDAHSGHDTYTRTIVNHWASEGTVELNLGCHISSGEDGLGADSKFFVEGKASLLDQEGEWFFDPNSARLYLWPPGGQDPTDAAIEIARRTQGIDAGYSDFVVDGLDFRGFNYEQDYWDSSTAAVFVSAGGDDHVANVAIRNTKTEHAARGFRVIASFSSGGSASIDNVLIEDSEVAHMDAHALSVQTWPNDEIRVTNMTVQRCLFHDLAFRNPEPTNSMSAVSISRVSHFYFLDNEVHTFSHNGVQFNYDNTYILIKGNHFHHCALNAADNGCVKFWYNLERYDPSAPRSVLAMGNFVHDSMGFSYASEVNEWWQTTGLSGSGFYCDLYRGATFFRNVMHTMGCTGLWQNRESNYNWNINNTVLNSRYGVSLGRRDLNGPDHGDSIVLNNLFMNYTTWGFDPDHYWGQTVAGVYYGKVNLGLDSRNNAYNDVFTDMLYVDPDNRGQKYVTVQDIVANTPWGEGSIDIDLPDSAIVADASAFDVHPVPSSPVIDAGADLPEGMAELLERLGLTLGPPEGAAYDIGAIEGATGGPWINVTFPNGSETLPTGGRVTVTWQTSALVGPVAIDLATDFAGSPQWQTLAEVTANDGAETVTLPAVREPSCRIRIREAADGDPEDLSDADFEIGDAIHVLSPSGGETLAVGQAFDIIWSSGGVDNVDIELSRDGGASWEPLARSIPASDGAYTWTVTGPASARCLVRVTDSSDGDPSGRSASEFEIVGQRDKSGCGCQAARPGSASLLLLVLLLAGLSRFRTRLR